VGQLLRLQRLRPPADARKRQNPTTRDFTAEAAENAENGRKQGNGRKTTGDPDNKAQESSSFSAFSAISAVKK
jgi:hypothetical protein